MKNSNHHLITDIKKHYNVSKIIIQKNHHSWGSCYSKTGLIIINAKFDSFNKREIFFNILFHEIGHRHCYLNGIWKNYHSPSLKNKRCKLTYKRIALKTERWIENWAEKEMKKWFPKLNFSKGYYTKELTDNFRKKINKLTS